MNEVVKDIETLLLQGCKQLQLNLSDSQLNSFMQYLLSLKKWNQKINLTAVGSLVDMVRYHLLDSLVIAPYVSGQRVVDVGSGAGLPGIPLAVIFPEKKFTLIDSRNKKTHFISQVVREMKLNNIEVVADRVESYSAKDPFDVIITRAFAEPHAVIELTRHLMTDNGRWLLMIGVKPESVLDLEKMGQVNCIELNVPGLLAERHVIIIDK